MKKLKVTIDMQGKDVTLVKACTDEDGRMVFEPQGKGAEEDV